MNDGEVCDRGAHAPLHSRRSRGHRARRDVTRRSGASHAAAPRPRRQETAQQMTERPAQRTPNRQLAALIAEAGFSNAGLARRVDQLGLEHGLDLRYDKTSVTRWLRGQQPRGTTPALIAEVFTRRLGRRLSAQDLGPRRLRARLRGPGVRRHPRGGRRHRQRAVAQGLRQPRRAAQDRLHPGRARRAQPGLADRPGRRPASPTRRPSLRGARAGPPASPRRHGRRPAGPPRARQRGPDRARPRPAGHRRGHRRAPLGRRALPHPRPRLRRRPRPPGPRPLPGARGRADAARHVRRGDRPAAVRAPPPTSPGSRAGPRTTSPRTGSPSATSSRRCGSRRRPGTGRTAAYVLVTMSRQAVYLGHGREAVQLARVAQQGVGSGAPPVVQALLHAVRGARARRARRGPGLHAPRSSGPNGRWRRPGPATRCPHWARFFDEAQLADEFGHCHRDLQQYRAAAQHAERSLQLRAPGYARSRLFCRVVLASARLGPRRARPGVRAGRGGGAAGGGDAVGAGRRSTYGTSSGAWSRTGTRPAGPRRTATGRARSADAVPASPGRLGRRGTADTAWRGSLTRPPLPPPSCRPQRLRHVHRAARPGPSGSRRGPAPGVQGALDRAGVPVVAAHVQARQQPYRAAQVVRRAASRGPPPGRGGRPAVPSVGRRAVEAGEVRAYGRVQVRPGGCRAPSRRSGRGRRGRGSGRPALITAVCATGPPRSASRSSDASVGGGSSARVVEHRHRVEGGYAQAGQQFGGGAGAGRQQDGAAAEFAVVVGGHDGRGRRTVTRTPVRTVPGGSAAREQLRQRRPRRPPADTAGRARSARSARSAHRLDVVSSGSQSSAASSGRRKPSIVRAGRPRAASACGGGALGAGQQACDGVAGEPGERGAEPGLVERAADAGGRARTRGPRGRRGALARARAAVSAPRRAPRAPGAPARCRRRRCAAARPGRRDAGPARRGPGSAAARDTRWTAAGRPGRAGSRRPSRWPSGRRRRARPPGPRSSAPRWSADVPPRAGDPGPHDDDVRLVRGARARAPPRGCAAGRGRHAPNRLRDTRVRRSRLSEGGRRTADGSRAWQGTVGTRSHSGRTR